MAIRVNLLEEGRFVEIFAEGQITRREAGWATERTRELVGSQGISGILADAGDVEEQASPILSGEVIEGFLFAIESLVPVAYVRPSQWTEDYYRRVREHVGELPPTARYFEDRAAALNWLCEVASAVA